MDTASPVVAFQKEGTDEHTQPIPCPEALTPLHGDSNDHDDDVQMSDSRRPTAVEVLFPIDVLADVGKMTLQERTALNAKLIQSADRGNSKSLRQAIEAGADMNYQDEEGRSSLIWAAKNGQITCVRMLVCQRADLDLATKHGATALGLAAFRGFKDVARHLISSGAEIDTDGKTPLMWASEYGHWPVVQLLLENKADVTRADKNLTALVLAAQRGHADIVGFLTDAEASSPRKSKESLLGGQGSAAALTWAARNGTPNVLTTLLRKRVDPSGADPSGATPLMWAAAHGHLEIVELLVAESVMLDSVMDTGDTAMMLAAGRGHADIVGFLIRAGASVYHVVEMIEAGGDFCRLAPVLSLGAAELQGVSLEAFARRISLSTVAGLIQSDGQLTRRFLDALFVHYEVRLTGDHPIRSVQTCYMPSEVLTAVDAVDLCPEKLGIMCPATGRSLAPQTPAWFLHSPLRKVTFWRCVLPHIWSVEVVHAFCTCLPESEVYQGMPCQAIMHHALKEVLPLHLTYIACKFSIILALLRMAVELASMPMQADPSMLPTVYKVALAVLWSFHFISDAHECFERIRRGWRVNLMVVMYNFLTFSMVLKLTVLGGQSYIADFFNAPILFRVQLAVILVWEWCDFTYSFLVFRIFGLQCLPILVAMREIRAFTCIMMLTLAACLHAYIVLVGLPNEFEDEPIKTRDRKYQLAVLLIWRLGLLGDFDIAEFEANARAQLDPDNPEKDPLIFVVDLVFMVISFGFTVLLMNIFIGVVGNTYNSAVLNAEATFLRTRSKIVLDHMLGPLYGPLTRLRGKSKSSSALQRLSGSDSMEPLRRGLTAPNLMWVTRAG